MRSRNRASDQEREAGSARRAAERSVKGCTERAARVMGRTPQREVPSPAQNNGPEKLSAGLTPGGGVSEWANRCAEKQGNARRKRSKKKESASCSQRKSKVVPEEKCHHNTSCSMACIPLTQPVRTHPGPPWGCIRSTGRKLQECNCLGWRVG